MRQFITLLSLLLFTACQTTQVSPTLTTEPAAPTPTALPATATPTQAPAGIEANDQSGDPTGLPPGVSADGRWVVFASYASNLVADDTQECQSHWAYQPKAGNCLDVFARDRESGLTRRLSIANDGTPGEGESYAPVISADGRWVAFRSQAELAPDFAAQCAEREFPDNCTGLYLHDLQNSTTALLAVVSDNGGLGGNLTMAISAEGRFIAFGANEGILPGLPLNGDYVYVYDRQTAEIKLAEPSDETCQPPPLTAVDHWQPFACEENALLVFDAALDSVISVSTNYLASDGWQVAFASNAPDLVPDDTNECDNPQFGLQSCSDIFIRDFRNGDIERVSLASDGSEANGDSTIPSLSADGRLVAFASDADNLVPNDTNAGGPDEFVASYFDIFVHDRDTGQTERVSLVSDGSEANGDSRWPRISADGRWVVFVSRADNLAPGDTNGVADVFIHDRDTGLTERVSVTSP